MTFLVSGLAMIAVSAAVLVATSGPPSYSIQGPSCRAATPGINEKALRSDEFIRHVTNKFVTTWLFSEKATQEAALRPDGVGDENDVRLLEPGASVKRELTDGQRHIYQIKLRADQFLKVIIEQQGIDVVAQVSSPDGAMIQEMDSESRLRGQEQASLVAEAAGDYRLIVRPKQPEQNGSAAGSYEIRIDELRAATENDRVLQEAGKLLKESVKLQGAAKHDEAMPLVERSLEICERILGPDHRDVAATLHALGAIHWNKGEYAKAEPLYQRALTIFERALSPEDPRIAITLNSLAALYWNNGDYVKAEPQTLSLPGNDPLRASDLRLNTWAAHIKNPLLRSGLALAGVNSWKKGDDDGLLTALEVAGLDLWGTKLVALSACDTGLGEIRIGEGVQGLRRALVLAGSESQVMSLWAVSDDRAKDVMIPYYKALRRGEGRGEGLRQAQLRMLRSKEHRHPFYWATFIQSGEWANLNGRR